MSAPSPAVWVIDDDVALGKVLVSLLHQEGLKATHFPSAEPALARLASERVDLVLSDLRMPGMDGMALLAKLKAEQPELPVVILTAHGTVPLAVEAMKAGAAEFVMKPFDRDELLYVVRKALTRASVEPPEPARFPEGIIGGAPAMQEALELARKAAAGDATVLIRGESGTGKELVARAIHEMSSAPRGRS